jgi:hypothetical protein
MENQTPSQLKDGKSKSDESFEIDIDSAEFDDFNIEEGEKCTIDDFEFSHN